MIVQLDSRHVCRNLIGPALLAVLTVFSTLLSAQVVGEAEIASGSIWLRRPANEWSSRQ